MAPRSTAAKGEVEAFFSNYPPPVETLAHGLRALVFEIVPDAQEVLDRSARVVGYGFGTGYKNTVCAIILSQKGVKLGLGDGASLPDPKGLLVGEGKRHRHIKFETPADLKKSGVKPLLKACYAAWKKRSAASGARTKNK
jgi:hypothetical protein